MAKAQVISRSKMVAKVGQKLDAIVDEIDAICHTKTDATEIDGNLFIDEGFEAISVGDIVSVEVDEADDYDLWAKLA